MNLAAMMLIALMIDAMIGWPEGLYRRIGHPVTWIGALIAALERRLNRPDRRRGWRIRAGAALVALVVVAAALPAMLVQQALPSGWAGALVGGILAWPFLAIRSLHEHVAAVARPLGAGDIGAARRSVSMIVGRDPSRLDAGGIARAALESLAENASDGIVAPLFWGVVAGLPGIAVYKAVNTMDSMIGHRTPRHEAFGKTAARLDDLANWFPARLTGLMMALVSGRGRTAFRVMMADARSHRSPNAGWPEAAMAGGLGVRLSGPRAYADRQVEEPWVNGGAPDPTPEALRHGLALYRRTMFCLAILLAGVALA